MDAMTDGAAIEVRGLRKAYGAKQAVASREARGERDLSGPQGAGEACRGALAAVFDAVTKEVLKAADAHDMAVVLTGVRHFRH